MVRDASGGLERKTGTASLSRRTHPIMSPIAPVVSAEAVSRLMAHNGEKHE
jgi:hypothetical protein